MELYTTTRMLTFQKAIKSQNQEAMPFNFASLVELLTLVRKLQFLQQEIDGTRR